MKYLSLREIQKEELEILKKVDKFMRKNNLRYSLNGGTLLGAIRHKGFIPWDDDIDIMMPRPDYDKFVKLFTNSNPYNELDIQCPENNTCFFPYTKVINKNFEVLYEEFKNKKKEYLWIDVFPVDGVPNDEKEYKRLLLKSNIIGKAIVIRNYKIPFSNKKYIKNVIKLLLKPFTYFINCNQLIRDVKKINYDDCKYAAKIVAGYGKKEKLLKSDFEEYTEVIFEGEKFYSIKDYDKYLTNTFGDYMTLPPEEDRVKHNVKVWRINSDKENKE